MAKGYNKTEGIYYEETFSPTAKMVTIIIFTTLDVNSNWSLFQLDIKNNFLFCDLDEHVYMSLPLRYHSKGDKRVLKLLKSLYIIKQAL